jgi:hypothetical protein
VREALRAGGAFPAAEPALTSEERIAAEGAIG